MKKILAAAIVLVMLVAMVACDASKGDLTSINDYVAPNYTFVTETGTFTFAEAGGNTAVITGYVGKAEAHAVTVPAQVTVASLDENTKDEDNVRKIVGIADSAFYYCTAMTSVSIPDSIQTIGKWAFAGCTGLSEIVLPDSVVSIGEGAFHGCDKLTAITLSGKLEKIDDFAFYGCKGLTAIALPETLVEIGSAAFFGNLFGVKPVIISDYNGQNVPICKVKGRRASLDKLVELTRDAVINPEKQTVYIAHADCGEDAEYLKGELLKLGFADAYIYFIGPIIGACIGPDAIGVWCYGKKVETAI